MKSFILIWGGGDLASGVALRLQRVGLLVLIVETLQPLAVRRSVSFCQAVYDGQVTIEGIKGQRVDHLADCEPVWRSGSIPIMVDPNLDLLNDQKPVVLIDARMKKKYEAQSLSIADLVIGLGPGFVAGENCHAAIETNRGHFLGRVYWNGSPEPDTGIPGTVLVYAKERVLHAPQAGVIKTKVNIGDAVAKDEEILSVSGAMVLAPFSGVVRGLIHDGLEVRKGMKVGDIDPRPETFRCWTVSEKSLAIGGGVLEAILTLEAVRKKIWET